jgi:hypothetical protein
MSKPQNILAKYRTYSYHHILIACDNEASAEYIRSSTRLSAFRDLSLAQPVRIDEEGKLQRVDRRDDASGEVNQTNVGHYVVILNGMIDTSFVVKSVEWFTATAASAVANDSFTSLAVEGKMMIEEPRGVRFLNALNAAADLLHTDPSGVTWMLKTIFIGHTDSGTTDYITDLLPLEFMMYDVTGSFSESGGVYEISFAGASNGASRYPQFSRIAKEIPVPVRDGTIKKALQFLEGKMNEKSSANRICVIDALKKAYPQLGADAQAELEEFRQVVYKIEPDDVYDETYKLDTLTEQEKDVNTDDGGGVIKAGPGATVESVIRNIMDRCSRVQKDRTEGDAQGFRYLYKIHSEITMVGKDGNDPINNETSETDFVAVVYRIRRHVEFTNEVVNQVLTGGGDFAGAPGDITAAKVRENTLELDYFFTGKNIDITQFDLKMDMGLAFLQTLSTTNNLLSGTYQISGTEDYDLNKKIIVPRENTAGGGGSGNTEEDRPKILIRRRTPIFPSTNMNNVMTQNMRGALDSNLYQAYMSRHAALESIEANVTIHGNPYLMSSTNRKPSATQRRSKAQGDEGDVTNIMANWENIPGLAKVNIFMPSTNDTPSDREVFEREQFWWRGYYYIYGIDHKFSDGIFQQDLHLISLPNYSELENTQETDITECGIEQQKGAASGATGEGATGGEAGPNQSEALASSQRDRAADPGGA